MNDLEKEIKKLSRLAQYKKADKSSLEHMAQINVWKRQTKIADKFSDSEDKTIAEKLFDSYLTNYVFNSYNDITNVVDLVYEEMLKISIQKQIDKIVSDKNIKFVPDKLIASLHDIEERVWTLKEKAGIVGDKEQDDLSALEELKKKFKIFIAHNRNEFTLWSPVICKKCGEKDIQPILLRRRVKDFKALKHPFFSGRFYYNRRGMELVKEGIWTKEQYAFVFQTSVKYVDWCLENEHKIVEIDGVEEQEIKNFINSKSYLKKEKIPTNIKKEK